MQLSTLDTSADIFPAKTIVPKKIPALGLYTVDNGSIVPVYSYDNQNNIFHVQVG